MGERNINIKHIVSNLTVVTTIYILLMFLMFVTLNISNMFKLC